MNSVIQMRLEAHAVDVMVSPMLRPYSVMLSFNGESHDIHVLALKSCDAISTTLDMLFDGEDEMPESMSIKARPANILRAA